MNLPASTISHDLLGVDKAALEAGAKALALAREQVGQALPPVTREEIAEVLGSMAEMLQVTVPSPTGLKLYFAALKGMPSYKFRAAAMRLIKTHKWPRLPLPADFLEAAQEERRDVELYVAKLHAVESTVRLALEKVRGRS